MAVQLASAIQVHSLAEIAEATEKNDIIRLFSSFRKPQF